MARYERARAAIAAGELPAAASSPELLRFGEAFGHQAVGSNHTAIMMVQVLTSLGRAEEALDNVLASLSAVRPGRASDASRPRHNSSLFSDAMRRRTPRQLRSSETPVGT